MFFLCFKVYVSLLFAGISFLFFFYIYFSFLFSPNSQCIVMLCIQLLPRCALLTSWYKLCLFVEELLLWDYWKLSSSFYLFSISTIFPFFLCLFFLWWKLSEASPSATVSIFTKLCPLLKAFQCCSTLWALSCLVSLLVTLLALTGSQVKLIVRASCICICHLCIAFPISPSPHYDLC